MVEEFIYLYKYHKPRKDIIWAVWLFDTLLHKYPQQI